MGIIANQMAVELFFKIKEKFKVKKEEKKQQKKKSDEKIVLIDASKKNEF